MRYVITHLYFGFDDEIEISENEFKALHEARNRALLLSSLEEKFMLVLENYEELEQEILRLSLHQMIFLDRSAPTFIDNLRLINRRFLNFLATCRLYKDHSAHDVSTIYGKNSKQFHEYDHLHSKQYEHSIGYRVMEAARNFSQHRSLIISGINHKIDRKREDNHEAHLSFINLSIPRLREEGGFKVSVLSELEAISEENGNVDIRPLMREYISSIIEIHLELRNIFDNITSKFDSIILDAIDRLNSLSGKEHDSVYIVAYKDGDEIAEKFPLLRDFIERRRRIIKKTEYIKLDPRSYVISK